MAADRFERRRAAVLARVEDHHSADVHVRALVGLLELEEGRVERRQPLSQRAGPSFPWPMQAARSVSVPGSSAGVKRASTTP